MTPEGRVAAAISILNDLCTQTTPVDRALSSWARSNRYAGSKDRRAISQFVYDAIRQAHRAAAIMDAAPTDGRAIILGSLKLSGNNVDQIAALFTGEKFSAPALTEDEKTILQTATDAPLLSGLPAPFAAALSARAAGSEAAAFEALTARAPLDIRLNTTSNTVDNILVLLAEQGYPSSDIDGVPLARRINDGAWFTDCDAYKSGLVEIQDAGSQIAAMMVPVASGQSIVDYCAGGGGKALALADRLGGKGQVFAHDIAANRLASLSRRADRAKARNIQIFDDAAKLREQVSQMNGADHVVLDVPCSGSGALRRNPETLWRYNDDRLAQLRALQSEILAAASQLTKAGGAVTYITCSILPEENEQVIEGFLAENKDFELEPLDASWPAGLLDGTVQLMPHLTQTDGFFIARLRRAC